MGSTVPSVMGPDDVSRALRRMAHEIVERNEGAANLVLVGIHTRGVPLAHRLAAVIGEIEDTSVPVGTLDIGLYRDDLSTRPTTRLAHTGMPSDISGRAIVLVDDVLFTGRTIRAALDALADLGRPSVVQLAALVDRGHRQLPIRADFVGKNLPTSSSERVHVHVVEIDGEDAVTIEEQA